MEGTQFKVKLNVEKISIFIPGLKKTGGPESLHNLAFHLQNKYEIDCDMYVYVGAN